MSASKLRVRSYESADLDALFQLDQVCFSKPFQFSRSAMKRFAEAKNARVVIGELEGEIAAFCIAHIHTLRGEKVAYITTIDVAPEHRRKGIAHILMRSVEAQVAEGACFALTLHVYAENEATIRFYEREGFVPVGMQENFYSEGLHALIYRKTISQTAVDLSS